MTLPCFLRLPTLLLMPGVLQRALFPHRSLLPMLTPVKPKRGVRKGLWHRQITRRTRQCWTCGRRPPRRLTWPRISRRTMVSCLPESQR